MEEEKKTVPVPMKTPSPMIEDEAEHHSDNLNDYNEYASGLSSEGEASEREQAEEEEQASEGPSSPKQFNFDHLEAEGDDKGIEYRQKQLNERQAEHE